MLLYSKRVNALTNRPKCIVHTYIMNVEYKGIGLRLCKWLNFDLLKLKDYSDWKRFMGFNHYIYKSSFSPAVVAASVAVAVECVLYIVFYWYRVVLFYSLLIHWTSVFSCYVGNTSYSLVLNTFYPMFSWSLRPCWWYDLIRHPVKKKVLLKYNSKESNVNTI